MMSPNAKRMINKLKESSGGIAPFGEKAIPVKPRLRRPAVDVTEASLDFQWQSFKIKLDEIHSQPNAKYASEDPFFLIDRELKPFLRNMQYILI